MLFGRLWETEVLSHFGLDKVGGQLESFIGVLLIDSCMVFARHLAAFQHEGDKWIKLRIGVPRIMHMGRRLIGC